MSPVLELVLQASSQILKPLIIEGSNTKLNPLSHMHRDSLECWKDRKKYKMSPMLELVLQVSSQLWKLLVIEGSIIEFNALSHMH